MEEGKLTFNFKKVISIDKTEVVRLEKKMQITSEELKSTILFQNRFIELSILCYPGQNSYIARGIGIKDGYRESSAVLISDGGRYEKWR